MSYDIHLEIEVDTGGPEPYWCVLADIGNYTANVVGMWDKALGYRLADLHAKRAGDALDDLQRAVRQMQDHPEVYRPMEPSNGWGHYEGALDYLRRLRDACLAHPKATIVISH